MKRIFRTSVAVLVAASFALIGCNKDEITDDGGSAGTPDVENPDEPEVPELKPISLTASPVTIILEESASDGVAVSFSWVDGNVYDEDVTYSLSANLYGKADVLVLPGITEKSRSVSGKELNSLIVDRWNQEPGKKVTVEVKVAAMAGEAEKAVSEPKLIDVTPYGEAVEYSAISLYGSATGDVQVSMTSEEPGIFSWEGKLESGLIKVLCNPDGTLDTDWFIATESEKEIVLGMDMNMVMSSSKDDGRDDFSWKIRDAGKYSVTVNTRENTIRFMITSKFYSSIGMVGPAAPNEWDAVNPVLLDRSGNVFEWEGTLNKGTIRFLCDPQADKGWEVDQFIASEKDKPIVSGQEEAVVLAAVSEPDRGDHMWLVQVPGIYRIRLDIENLVVVFTLVQTRVGACSDIAMIGPASPGGWDMSSIENLTGDGRDWHWSGHLNTGEIQFLCDRTSNGNDWGEFRLVPAVEGELVCPGDDAKPFDYMPSAEDWKWNIAVSGDYEIMIGSEAQTVMFLLKESDAGKAGYPDLGLIGGAAPQGWNPSDYSNSTLVRNGDVYEWEGHLGVGDLNIFCDTSDNEWKSPRLTAWDAGTEVEPGKRYMMRYMENDNKWQIKVPGTYKVTVDLNAMSVVYELKQED